MIPVLRTELAKQLRRPRTYVALGIVALIPVIITVALSLSPPEFRGRGGTTTFFYYATQTGLFVPAVSLVVVSRLLLPFVVAVFAGDAIAAEGNWGTLRYLLVRPVRRGRVFVAKLITVIFFSAIGSLLIVVSGLIAGTIAFGWNDLPPVAQIFGFDQGTGEIARNMFLATLYVGWAMAAAGAFAFMVSTMTDVPAGAIGAGFGLFMTSQIVDAIEPLADKRNYLPTHYLEAWTGLFNPTYSGGEMLSGILIQIPYVIVFCAIGWWWFHRRDIKS
jgi:ABC-2 type transport system permease protein